MIKTIAVCLICALVAKSQAESSAKIETLVGPKAVVTSGLQEREARIGMDLQAGEGFRTDSATSGKIIFTDGSAIAVGRDSEVVLDEESPTAFSVRLVRGTVQAQIAKLQVPSQEYKFFIRTSAAVMGVRGTIFVVEHADKTQSTEVHTQEGVVDVAGSSESLLRGDLKSLTAGISLKINSGSLGNPEKFNTANFSKYLSAKQPDLQKVLNAPASPKGPPAFPVKGKDSKVTSQSAKSSKASPPPPPPPRH